MSGNPQPERRERSGEDAGDVQGRTAPVASGAVRIGTGGVAGTARSYVIGTGGVEGTARSYVIGTGGVAATTRRDASSGTIGASAAAGLKRPR